MNRTFLQLLALGVLCLSQPLLAQDYSKDWGNYTNYLDRAGESHSSAVNEFTGSINYSFNFYTLNVDGQGFPVSINYASNGLKVDEYASNVGLGWNLNAGGTITKITRGLDDFEANKGYHDSGSPLRTPENIYNGLADGEKDYYVFSAFGLGGTFYYDEVAAAYKPLAGEKITIEWVATPGTFIIRDDAGSAFHFTKRETIYTYSQTTSNLVNTQQGNWFLTKVVLASKKEVLLTYHTKTVTGLKVAFNEISSIAYGSCNALPNHIGHFIYNTYNSFRLQSISSGNTSINFGYNSSTRQDITDDYALEKIEVVLNGANFKRYVLSQDYHSNRLMLNEIIDQNFSTSQNLSLAQFSYFKDYTMPDPVSVQSQDWMGYFNNQAAYTTTYYSPNFKSLAPAYQTPGTTGSAGIEPGANRDIAASGVVQTLMLKKVSDLYGKTQEFTYEPNYYNVQGTNQNGPYDQETLTHGVRIAEVTSYESAQPLKKKYIKYIYKDGSVSTGILTTLTAAPTVFGYGCTRVIRTPYIRRTRAQVADGMVIYKQVKTQVYTNPSDLAASTLGYTVNTYGYDNPGYVDETPGGVSRRVFYADKFMWGKLMSTKSYNKAQQLINRTDYGYSSASSKKYFGTYVWLGAKLANGQNDAAAHFYYTSVGYNRLTSVTQYTYNPDALLLSTAKQTYTYDANGYVSETQSFVNSVLKARTTYKRPYDYSVSGIATEANGKAIYQMNQQKIAAPVIESISYKVAGSTETVVSGGISLHKYDNARQVILSDKTLTYQQGSPQSTVTALTFHSTGTAVYPASYRITAQANAFDDKLLPVEVISENVEYTAMHYNDNGNVLCTFSHAKFLSTGFMGFEPYEIAKLTNNSTVNANWTSANGFYNTALVNTAATGTAAMNLSLCGSFTAMEFTQILTTGNKYILRYWRKNGSGSVSVLINNSTQVLEEFVINKMDGWELIERRIDSPGMLSIAGTAIIDDLVLLPQGSEYQYQVYNNKDLKIAESDAQGNSMFYEYDEHCRTKFIKDKSGNVLKAFEYGIQEQQ